ncbi:hypothetical protein NliqN6_1947 [Naganishia liquefaciens]|uniref:SH3 domain-containing protein n=1 Tax=Naganishia liquefaciens TaxID=104408 RepID=A0A8H3TRZ7_9TREE|nr:hypothetical protein NliqN6_1947 [Naganishia liquefaciens]
MHFAVASAFLLTAWAQVMKPDGCLLLSGTITCPPWSTAWVNPMELANDGYPAFANVTDLASFDAAAISYIGNPGGYRTDKFANDELGCTNASNVVVRYSRTVFCSALINSQSSMDCFNRYSEVDRDIGPKYVCQSTCNEYSANEYSITRNRQYCPTDPSGGDRYLTLIRDYASCTNWASSLTNNTDTCIEGDLNEGSCGFAGSTAQLCAHCNVTLPEDCCYQSNTDLRPCGYTLAAKPSSTTSGTTTSSSTSTAVAEASRSGRRLNGGQIAGIVIGSVIGGLMLLLGLLFCCGVIGAGRRKRRHTESEKALHSPGEKEASYEAQSGMPTNTMLAVTGKPGSDTPITAPPLQMPGALASPLPVGGTSAPGERSVLASMKDENQSGDHLILPNTLVTVLWPYTAAMADEITLYPGMRLKVLRIYDDAWATGQVVDSAADSSLKGKEGAFPLVCVTQAEVPIVASRS